MKKIIIHINNKMPALWDSKMTFVSVSQFLWLALCSLFGSVSRPFVTPCLIVSLGGRKKKEKKREERIRINLLLTLNLFNEFCWSSWMPQEEGGWALLFSLCMVLGGWGAGLGPSIHSCRAPGPGPPWAARLKSATQSVGVQRESSHLFLI